MTAGLGEQLPAHTRANDCRHRSIIVQGVTLELAFAAGKGFYRHGKEIFAGDDLVDHSCF